MDPAPINCDAALALAISALPPGDLPTLAIFTYGTNCGAIAGCGLEPEYFRVDFGLVTFRYEGDTHWEFVYVVADEDGRLQLAGEISPSPPSVLSVPTPIPSVR